MLQAKSTNFWDNLRVYIQAWKNSEICSNTIQLKITCWSLGKQRQGLVHTNSHIPNIQNATFKLAKLVFKKM